MVRTSRRVSSLRGVLEFTQFLEGVSAKIHGVLDEKKLYQAIREEFNRSKKYSATILALTDDSRTVKVVETSFSPARRTGSRVRLKGRAIELRTQSILRQALKKGRTIGVTVEDIAEELIPGVKIKVNPRERHAVIAPVEKHRKIVGAIAVSSPGMSTEVMRSVKRFSQHVSAALELADRYSDRKRVEDELRSSREQLRNLSRYLQSVREEERSQIAREIHDELGQTITALKLDLLGLKDELPKKQRSLARKTESMVGLTDRSLQTVH